jgi:L-rhamnose isomerase
MLPVAVLLSQAADTPKNWQVLIQHQLTEPAGYHQLIKSTALDSSHAAHLLGPFYLSLELSFD